MVTLGASTSYSGGHDGPVIAVHLSPTDSGGAGPAPKALPGEHSKLSLPPALQRMPDSLKRIFLTANGSSRLDGSGSCGASWRSAEDSAAGHGAGADGAGSKQGTASCSASWHSAEDSAAALGASGKGAAGIADKDAAGSSSGGDSGGSSLSLYDELDADDIWGDPYGADAWRAPWRRHESLAGCWVLLAVLSAVAINLGVGAAVLLCPQPQSTGSHAALPCAGWSLDMPSLHLLGDAGFVLKCLHKPKEIHWAVIN